VRIEFYGLARLRAGRGELHAVAETVGDALAAADAACPELRVLPEGKVSPHYLVSVGGRRFTAEPGEILADGDDVLVLGADAGG
jgi:molybdopterin converting factor small subunit